jgi:hypothetical protein
MLALDRLVEASADAVAATVNGLQAFSARRRSFSIKRSVTGAASGGVRYFLARAIPAIRRSERPKRTGASFLRVLIAGGVPATSTLARIVFVGTVRAAPVVWKVSRDRRAQATVALLLRIVLGHKRRHTR